MKIANKDSADRQSERDEIRQEFDSPWKKVIEVYFQSFVEFFFPQIYSEINWSRGYEFLDKEFQQAVHEAESGRSRADKLVKVWTVGGQETWVLMHIEVQNQRQNDFAQRMFVYHYRIYDYYKQQIASVAILGDRTANWKPDIFRSELWGCHVDFHFPVVKLMDYLHEWPMLESSKNPFAIVTMAHLLAQKTYNDNLSRAASKSTIIRHLFKQGYERQNVINLLIFIDWILTLPKVLEQKIRQEVRNFEENKKMQYVTSFERLAKEEGIEQGIVREREHTRQLLLQNLKKSLKIKFGDKGLMLLPVISKLKSSEELIAFQSNLIAAKSIEELKKWCAKGK